MTDAPFRCSGPDLDGCEQTCPEYQQQHPTARLFVLERDTDVSGVSGTGTVADGVQWPNGLVTVCWRGQYSSVSVWQSLDDATAIHGHNGSTRVVFQ